MEHGPWWSECLLKLKGMYFHPKHHHAHRISNDMLLQNIPGLIIESQCCASYSDFLQLEIIEDLSVLSVLLALFGVPQNSPPTPYAGHLSTQGTARVHLRAWGCSKRVREHRRWVWRSAAAAGLARSRVDQLSQDGKSRIGKGGLAGQQVTKGLGKG
eukprot:scaffold231871_cov14-Tisochrysis_lutea.AAC.1